MTERPEAAVREPHVTVDADFSQLGRLRADVGELARASGASDDVIDKLQLVVSELATNVIQHSDSDTVTVQFERVAEGWQLDVSDADGVVLPGDAQRTDPEQLSGRGLVIVEAVMDRVELLADASSHRIRCTIFDT